MKWRSTCAPRACRVAVVWALDGLLTVVPLDATGNYKDKTKCDGCGGGGGGGGGVGGDDDDDYDDDDDDHFLCGVWRAYTLTHTIPLLYTGTSATPSLLCTGTSATAFDWTSCG